MKKEFKCDCGCSKIKIEFFEKDKSLWIQLCSSKKILGEVVLISEKDIRSFRNFAERINV